MTKRKNEQAVKPPNANQSLDAFETFLSRNSTVDLWTFNLQDETLAQSLDFTGVESIKTEILQLAKAYQRLIRIIPKQERDIAIKLMKMGIHSALQISAMPRKKYVQRVSGVFTEDAQALAVYNNALEKREAITIQYMNLLQNSEPHISSARFC